MEKAARRTARKRAVLFFVTAYWREHGHAPSIPEVARAKGLSIYTANTTIDELTDDGWLTHATRKTRTLCPTIPFILLRGDRR